MHSQPTSRHPPKPHAPSGPQYPEQQPIQFAPHAQYAGHATASPLHRPPKHWLGGTHVPDPPGRFTLSGQQTSPPGHDPGTPALHRHPSAAHGRIWASTPEPPRPNANPPSTTAPTARPRRPKTPRRVSLPAYRLVNSSKRTSFMHPPSRRHEPARSQRPQAHRPRFPQYPEQHSGHVSPQLHESEQYPPVPAQGASQSLGLEQTPAPPGVPGDDAQQTSPSLHGCSVPVAHPHPIYVQLNPARLGSAAPTARNAPAKPASQPTAPRRDRRPANALVIASNRCPSIAAPPAIPPASAPNRLSHGIAPAAWTQEGGWLLAVGRWLLAVRRKGKPRNSSIRLLPLASSQQPIANSPPLAVCSNSRCTDGASAPSRQLDRRP